MDEEYVRKSDVDRLIRARIKNIKDNMGPGKGLTNSIINLQALRKEIDEFNELHQLVVTSVDI